MKLLWLVLTLIPAPFLFHFYEYGQHINREEPYFLLIGSILFVFITGFLAGIMKIRYIILVNGITGVLSLILGVYLIPNDSGWFTPFGRDTAIIFTAIIFLIGQLVISFFSRKLFAK